MRSTGTDVDNGKILGKNGFAVTHDYGPFHGIAQFANISGPGMAYKAIHQSLTQSGRIDLQIPTETGNEMAREQFDIIITDINMPDMNGIEVLRQMKEMNPTLPVILSTAYHEYKQDLGAWASDDYVVKSSDLTNLKKSVRRLLE